MLDTPLIFLPASNAMEVRQLLNDHSIDYYGVAACSIGVPEILSLLKGLKDAKLWSAFASVLTSWLARKSSRKVKIIYQDGRVVEESYEGFDVEEIGKLRRSIEQVHLQDDN
ncbi:TPA: hypothetical protein JD344_20220 [Serratia marcescens]|uniref:hypothetical protein n=1 Tax=Serratia TaxID=613 RepID=UPI0018D97197|nr:MULTISPECIES: hypothetical protein [Serratia]EMB4112089.1 hypothetical protein [Serratia marcescens]MBH2716601.1 hypothetical protein [Serratia marcescens]MDP8611937.1 hypothetical protein [Serratia marcescens]MDP8647212.1 hypothetical protein [Serratia marcescens]MDP8681527.1 hypothetical protein [Serratia marcescens]